MFSTDFVVGINGKWDLFICLSIYEWPPNLSILFQASTFQFNVKSILNEFLKKFYPFIFLCFDYRRMLVQYIFLIFSDAELCISVKIVTISVEMLFYKY